MKHVSECPSIPLSGLLPGLGLSAAFLACGCTLSLISPVVPSGAPSAKYVLASRAAPAIENYSGGTLSPAPSFGVYPAGSETLASQASDTVSLAAFLDSKCTVPADGALSAAATQVPVQDGLATFDDVAYRLPSGSHLEEAVYLQATESASGAAYCSQPVYFDQHFDGQGPYIGTGGATAEQPGFVTYLGPGDSGAEGGTGPAIYDSANEVLIDSAGRYLALGVGSGTDGYYTTVWRYFPDGTLDTSFGPSGTGISYFIGPDGSGTTGETAGNVSEEPWCAKIDPQGRIVAAGLAYNQSGGIQLGVWRFLPDGAPDTSFGAAGDGAATFLTTGGATASGNTTATGMDDEAGRSRCVSFDSQGRIVITGYSLDSDGGYRLALWRYTDAGLPDPSFGPGGTGAVTFLSASNTGAAGAADGSTMGDSGSSVYFDSQNRLIIIGRSKNATGNSQLTVWRYLDTGVPDTTFGSAGDGAMTWIAAGNQGAAGGGATTTMLDRGYTAAIDSLGRYAIVGLSNDSAGLQHSVVWRFNADWTLDSGFGTGGYTIITGPGGGGAAGGPLASMSDAFFQIDLDPWGNYLMGGYSNDASGLTRSTALRLTSAGALDPAYGQGGIRVFAGPGGDSAAGATGASASEWPVAQALDPQGRLLIGGISPNSQGSYQMFMVRFTNAGAVDQ